MTVDTENTAAQARTNQEVKAIAVEKILAPLMDKDLEVKYVVQKPIERKIDSYEFGSNVDERMALKAKLIEEIKQNLDAPIEHRVVFDLDGMIIQCLDGLFPHFTNSAVLDCIIEYLQYHYKGTDFIKVYDTYYLVYPDVDILILTILSWKGWSLDFFSAGGKQRNIAFVDHFLERVLDLTPDSIATASNTNYSKICNWKWENEKEGSRIFKNDLLKKLVESGRVQIISEDSILHTKDEEEDIINKLNKRTGSENDDITNITKKDLISWLEVKDLRMIQQTDQEKKTSELNDCKTDHIILVDDRYDFAHPTQMPYLHIYAGNNFLFHRIDREIYYVNEELRRRMMQYVPELNDFEFSEKRVETYISEWPTFKDAISSEFLKVATNENQYENKEIILTRKHLLWELLYFGNYHRTRTSYSVYNNIANGDYVQSVLSASSPGSNKCYSPLLNSHYIMGVLVKCKELIHDHVSISNKLPLRQALHHVLKREKHLSYPLSSLFKRACARDCSHFYGQMYHFEPCYDRNYKLIDENDWIDGDRWTTFPEFHENCVKIGLDYLRSQVIRKIE